MKQPEVISMSGKELKRLHVLQKVLDKHLRQKPAAELLGLSVRHLRRLTLRLKAQGPRGLIHPLRGRPSNRRCPDRLKHQVLKVYQKHYQDFGPTLASEKLAACHKLRVSRETLRQWLVQADFWHSTHKRRVHRQWRERKACFGEMIQLDGSHHDWLEGRGPQLVLMGYIDDATNRAFARFYGYEGTFPALDSFFQYAQRHGLPQSVYLDKHATYRSPRPLTPEDELAGRTRSQSQFERALGELGVQVVHAHSPQAKGRVERLFRTFQDRLIKEMRLARVRTQAQANAFLIRYLPIYNRRFTRTPRQSANLHHRVSTPRLRQALVVREKRVLRQDGTVAYQGRWYQIMGRWSRRRPCQVWAERRLDGKLYWVDQGRVLAYQEVRPQPRQCPQQAKRPRKPRYILPPDHPWRRWRLKKRLKHVA